MTDEPGIHKMPVGRYPFVILYTVSNDELVIPHVPHTSRKPITGDELWSRS